MDLLKTAGSVIETVAPTIATALGGPLAGMAVKALSTALFGNDTAAPEDISTALASPTADQLAALKKIENDFQVQMKTLEINLDQINEQDVASARQMQTVTKDWIPRLLAILVTVGFFGIIVWIMKFGMPESGKEILLLLVGSLGTAWTGIIQFYFGSSAGSKAKTDALTAALANNGATK